MRTFHGIREAFLVIGIVLLVSACGETSPSSNRQTPSPASISQLEGTKWFSGCVDFRTGAGSTREGIEWLRAGRFLVTTEEFSARNCTGLTGISKIEGSVTDNSAETSENLAVDLRVTYASFADYTPGARNLGVFVEYRSAVSGETLTNKISRNVLRAQEGRLYLNFSGFSFSATPGARNHALDLARPYVQLP